MRIHQLFSIGMIITALCCAVGFGQRSALAHVAQEQSAAQKPTAGSVTTGIISGHVTRADTGAPIAGVILALYPDPWIVPGGPAPLPPLGARSGADGAYTFASVEPGSYRAQIQQRSGFVTPERASGRISVVAGQGVQNIDFRLQPGGAISGSVHDEENDPIKGLNAFAFCKDEMSGRANSVKAGEAVTDDQGNFRISPISPGDCTLAITAEPPAGVRRLNHAKFFPNADSMQEARVLKVKAGEEIPDIRFVVPVAFLGIGEDAMPAHGDAPAPTALGGGSISGNVFRADTGTPLAGAVIRISHAFDRARPPAGGLILPFRALRTGRDGAFKFEGLEPGAYTLRVEHYGFVAATTNDRMGNSPGTGQISVANGQHIEKVDVRMQATGAISGNVRDQDGVLLKGIFVNVFCAASEEISEGPAQGGRSTTDDRGNFRVAGVVPGDCTVGAGSGPGPMSQMGLHAVFYPDAATMAKAKNFQVKPEGETSDLRLTMKWSPTFRISVKVIDDAKEGSESRFMITIRPTDMNSLEFANSFGFQPPQPIFTRDYGTANLRGFSPGTYVIEVIPGRITPGRNGQTRGWSAGGAPVGSATVQVVDGDVSVEIPVSRFPDGGRPQ
jgi:protocatechuate 3,4-dioxygenase beta subunit